MPYVDLPDLIEEIDREALAPDPDMTVSEWSDARRYLTRKDSAEEGPWRTSRVPYLREPMDAFSVSSPVQEIVLVFASQTGKALAISTPIATPSGWSTMGDLQAGDKVFDEAGRPTKVLATSPVMTGRDCYRVTFSDGAEIVADGEHLWTVDDETTGSNRGKRRTLRTVDMLRSGVNRKGRNVFAIPVAEPLRMQHREGLPIHPYALGAWLGDGCSAAATITQHAGDAPELAENLRRCGEDVTVHRVSETVYTLGIDRGKAARLNGRCRRGHNPEEFGVMRVKDRNGLTRNRCPECNRQSAMASKYGRPRDPILPEHLRFGERLKALGIFGKGAKRIPSAYLRASVKQRLELLRGLMDTDGTADTRGRMEIVLTSPGLAADVLELIRGLGLKPTTRVTATGNHRMTFSAYLPRSLFRLTRKRQRMKSPEGCRTTETGRRRIVSITPVKSVPVRCIKVEAASKLFLAGRELIPTHNSSAVNNCLGYAMDLVPGPALLVQPTEGMAKRYSKMRIAPMIESTPTLRDKVLPSRSRDSGNTLFHKEFINGAQLIIGGANSAASLASMPIRFAAEDEVDRFPLDVDEEGAPSDLVDARLRTFGDRKKRIKTSTPTLAGRSRIWWEWEQSDQRRYFVPCPHCDAMQVLTWDKLRYDPKDPLIPAKRLTRPPVMICEACGEGFGEEAKLRWYGEDLGEWRAQKPESIVRGYHLPGFYSPLGWQSWTDIVLSYEMAKGDPIKNKSFTNTVLAECYAEVGEVPDWETLYRRRETYHRGKVPAGGLVLTMAADVQRDRIELEVMAWGPNLEHWSVDYIVLPGDTGVIQTDPAKPCPWRNLAFELQRVYPCEGGGQLGISKMALDTGDQTQTCYAWIRQQADPRVMGIKGRGTLSSVLGIPTMQDVTYKGKRAKRGVKLWPVGVDTVKTEVYGWLRQEPPLEPGDPMPRGFFHFPEYGQLYFQGLTAEELRSKLVRGFTVYQWEKIRDRNEQLDVHCYNRAAAAGMGIDRWPEDEWERRRVALGQQSATQDPQEAAPAAARQAKARPRARSVRRAVSVGGR